MGTVRARHVYPAALATSWATWYAADSLRHRRENGHGYELRGDLDVRDRSFLRAAEALTAAPISEGSEVELLINGDQIFPAMLETIQGAERTLCLLTYVYWKGDIGREVATALVERARAGVRCHVLLDAVGSFPMDTDIVDELVEAGVEVARFRPPRPYAARRMNKRTHRKVIVADGRIGLCGGVGIADEWTGDAQDPDHWRDTHVRVRGPVVRGLFGAFAENWLEATGCMLAGEDYLPHIEPIEGGGPMQVVRSTAEVGDTNAEALFFLAIAGARRTLDLTSAYFAPRAAFEAALCRAAADGVAIRVLVPGPHMDKQFVRMAGRASYGRLLEGGVRIFEYQPTMLHAKTLVVDGAWSTVGSMNFDNRSFALQDEATLCVQSEEFAKLLTEQFELDLAHADEIRLDRFKRRGPLHRAQEAGLKLVRREI